MMRKEVIQIRVSEDEKVAFQNAAGLAGLAMSAWIRVRLRQTAVEELAKIDVVPDFAGGRIAL